MSWHVSRLLCPSETDTESASKVSQGAKPAADAVTRRRIERHCSARLFVQIGRVSSRALKRHQTRGCWGDIRARVLLDGGSQNCAGFIITDDTVTWRATLVGRPTLTLGWTSSEGKGSELGTWCCRLSSVRGRDELNRVCIRYLSRIRSARRRTPG